MSVYFSEILTFQLNVFKACFYAMIIVLWIKSFSLIETFICQLHPAVYILHLVEYHQHFQLSLQSITTMKK